MTLVAAKVKKNLEAAIKNSLAKEFKKEAKADKTAHKRMASAIAEAVAQVIVKMLMTDAQVLPGIKTAGSSSAQTSVKPGKIG